MLFLTTKLEVFNFFKKTFFKLNLEAKSKVYKKLNTLINSFFSSLKL